VLTLLVTLCEAHGLRVPCLSFQFSTYRAIDSNMDERYSQMNGVSCTSEFHVEVVGNVEEIMNKFYSGPGISNMYSFYRLTGHICVATKFKLQGHPKESSKKIHFYNCLNVYFLVIRSDSSSGQVGTEGNHFRTWHYRNATKTGAGLLHFR
jgi:hypothetical protein